MIPPLLLFSRPRSAYGMLCDNMLNKLTRKLPSIPMEAAPLVSAYLSAVSQHRDLSSAARPDRNGIDVSTPRSH